MIGNSVSLSDVVERCNKDNNHDVVSDATALRYLRQYGLIDQNEIFEKRVSK